MTLIRFASTTAAAKSSVARLTHAAIAAVFAVLTLTLASAQAQDADGHPALAGLKEVKVAFDLKHGNPDALVSSLNAIDDMRQSMINQGVTPRIVLAFRGPASKLVQTDLTELPEQHREGAAQVADKIEALRSAEGISSMEQCGLTVSALGLEPQHTIPGLKVVNNSWTALAAYQAQGYGYVAP